MRQNRLHLITASLLCCCLPLAASAQRRDKHLAPCSKLDGAYELVSETSVLSEPEPRSTVRKPPDWYGLWLFSDGHFSLTMAMSGEWRDPSKRHVGYESSAGTYKVEGSKLILRHSFNLSVLDAGGMSHFECRLEGEDLTLTEQLSATVEKLGVGAVTTVLRRVKQGQARASTLTASGKVCEDAQK